MYGSRSLKYQSKTPITRIGVLLWWNFTTKLELISRKMSKAQPRRLAGKPARCAPPEKPFAYFLDFPRRDFFDLEKGFLVVCLP